MVIKLLHYLARIKALRSEVMAMTTVAELLSRRCDIEILLGSASVTDEQKERLRTELARLECELDSMLRKDFRASA